VGPYDGGNALETMLKSSAADKTLLPSARHLKDLLASLEHRCVLSGFADTVIGWQIFLSNSPQTSDEFARFWKVSTLYPSSDGLEKLVDAFRQLSRIGDATSITLKTAACTPWVVAFTKWCLGIPPSIYLEDGTPLLEQPAARVTVIASKNTEDCPGIEIMIHQGVETPADLIVSSLGSNSFLGMLSIKCYGQWLRQEYDLGAGSGCEAIAQALPYALKQVVTLLQLSQYKEFNYSLLFSEWHQIQFHASKQIAKDVLRLAANPFAKDSFISATLSRILDSTEPSQLHSLKEGILIGDLPAVVSHLQYLKRHCTCLSCDSLGATSYEICEAEQFFFHLAYLVADVLALSLFDGPETPLVYLNHCRSGSDSFLMAILSILTKGLPSMCEITEVLQWALTLVGHNVMEDVQKGKWVISCYKGQTIYPKLFETQRLEKRGYLTLSWAPGLLRYDGEAYPRGVGVVNSTSTRDPVTSRPQNTVTIPLNLLPEYRLVWRIARQDAFLEINLGLEDSSKKYSHVLHPPFHVLTNMASILMLEACPHDAKCSLRNPDWFCAYTGPFSPMAIGPDLEDNDGKVGLVAVDGNDGLRMFALSAYPPPFPFVLRQNSCLSCCLDICRRSSYPVVIC
jgi:hypothetical protein